MYDNLPDLLTVDELAAVLRIGRNTAYTLVHSGKIHCVKIERQFRIPRNSLIEFLSAKPDPNSNT